MENAEQLKKAISSKNVPIDVVPDHQVGGKNYGQELVNQQPAGTYKYGAGPSTYSTIAPGTKTLQGRQQDLSEQKWQEELRQIGIAEQLAQATAASAGKAGSGYKGYGSGEVGATDPADGYYLNSQGERYNYATGNLYDRAITQYTQNMQELGSNASKSPLYFTINSILKDPDWASSATKSGADIKRVIDMTIVKYAGVSPEEYFKTPKGKQLKAAYQSLPGYKPAVDEDLAFNF